MGREAIRARLDAPATCITTTVHAFGEELTVRTLTWAETEEAAAGAFVDGPDGAREYSWRRHRLALLVLATHDSDGHRVFEPSEQDVALLENASPTDMEPLLEAVLRLNGFNTALEEARAKLFGGTGAGAQSSDSATPSAGSPPS